MKKSKIVLKRGVLTLVVLCFFTALAFSQGLVSIYEEDMGTPVTGNPGVGVHNDWQNQSVTYSGTADVRTSSNSTSCSPSPTPCYQGASGSGNVYFTNSSSKDFLISTINTSAHTGLTLSFGLWKEAINADGSEFVVSVSTDGINYTNLPFPPLPTTAGSQGWYYCTINTGIPQTSTLHLKFTNTSILSNNAYRLDDILLQGIPTTSTTQQCFENSIINKNPFLSIDNYIPWFYNFTYSYSQQLYTAAEIIAANGGVMPTDLNIYSMAWKWTGTTPTNRNNLDIYLALTTATTLTSYVEPTTTNFEQVYFASTQQFTNSSEWTVLTFSQPFLWDGVSNIVVTTISEYFSGSGTTHHGTDFAKIEATSMMARTSFQESPNPNWTGNSQNVSGLGNNINNNVRNSVRFSFGTPTTDDIKVLAITKNFLTGVPINPIVTISNNGTNNVNANDYSVNLSDGAGYNETVSITPALIADASETILFPAYTATSSQLTLTATVNYPNDLCNSNDILTVNGTALIVVTLPYTQNFESTTTEITYSANTTDHFVVGSATGNPGKSLYLSANGTSNTYSKNNAYATAEIIVNFGNFIEYALSFDWKCKGEGTTTPYDYGRVFLLDTNVKITSNSLPSGHLNGLTMMQQTQWQSFSMILSGATYANKIKKLVFVWRTDASSAYDPPLAIDNISLKGSNCTSIPSVTALQTDISANISWTAPSIIPQDGYEVAYATTNNVANAINTLTSSGLNITINSLTPNTTYYVWVRSVCNAVNSEYSNWSQVCSFKTFCVGTTTPFTENFTSYPIGATTNINCWLLSGNFNIATYTSFSGNTLRFNSSTTTANIVRLPVFDVDVNNCVFSFLLRREGSPSGSFDIGYLTNQSNVNTFQSVYQNVLTTTSSNTPLSFNLTASTFPAGIKNIALRQTTGTSSDYYYWIDDILVRTASSDKDILTFYLPIQTGPATINSQNKTIDIEVSNGTDLTQVSLNPTITISQYATILPASGNAIPFKSTVTPTFGEADYVVTAETGTPQTWTVTVTVAGTASASCDITAFSVNGRNGVIDEYAIPNPTIIVTLPWTTPASALLALNPSITYSNFANITAPSVLTNVDFSNSPVTYTVVAQNGTTKSYLVTVNIAPQPIVTIPYIEDFETYTPPTNEFTFQNQTNGWYVGSATSNPVGGKSLYISNNNGTSNQYTNTTASSSSAYITVDFGNFAEYNISFDWKLCGESTFDIMKVYIIPDSMAIPTSFSTTGTAWISGNGVIQLQGNATASGESYFNGVSPYNWTNFNQTFTGTLAAQLTGTTKKLVFLWRNDALSGTNPPIAIDNISITSSNCASATAITTVPTSNNVLISWTAPNVLPQDGYEIAYGTTNNISNATTITIASGATSTTISSLTPNTIYYVWMRSVCDAANSEYSSLSHCSFKTSCTSENIPWSYSFEDLTAANTLNNCWAATKLGDKVQTQLANDTYNRIARTGTCSMSFAYSCNDSVTTPRFYLTAGNDYEFSFWWIKDNNSGWQYLGASAFDGTTDNFIQIVGTPVTTFPTNGVYTQYKGIFTAPSTGEYYFRVRCQANSTPWYLTLDDFSLRNCITPFNITVNTQTLTPTFANITWNGLSQPGWNIAIFDTPQSIPVFDGSGSTVDYSINLNSPSYSTSVLTPNTTYYVYIESICDNSYASYTFTTPSACANPTNFALTTGSITNNSASFTWNDHGMTNWEFVVVNAANHTDSNSYQINFPYFTIPNNLFGNTTYIVYVRSNCGSGTYSNWSSTVTFTTLCGPTTIVGWSANFTGQANNSFPTCWKRYNNGVVSNTNPYITTSNNSGVMGGVNSSSGSPYMYFSNSTSLTLETPEFIEDINQYAVSFWISREGFGSGTFSVGYYAIPGNLTSFVALETIDDPDDQWNNHIVALNYIPNGIKRIAFRQNQGSASWYYWLDDISIIDCTTATNFMVNAQTITPYSADITWSSVSNTNTWNVEIYEIANNPGTPVFDGISGDFNYTVNSQLVNITGLNHSKTYIVYVQSTCNNSWSSYTFITPNICAVPTNLDIVAGSITNKAASFTWNTSGMNSWELFIVNDANPADTNHYTGINTNNFTIPNNLFGNTTYVVYVRSDCGSGTYSNWSSTITFTTKCDPFTLPFSEDFTTWITGPSTWNDPCWTKYTGSESYSIYYPYINLSGNASNSLYFYNTSTSVSTAFLPLLDDNNVNLKLEFDAQMANAARLSVITTNDPTFYPSWATIYTVIDGAGTSNNWKHYVIDVPNYTTGTYIGFKSHTSANYIYVDNVLVRKLYNDHNILTFTMPQQVSAAIIDTNLHEIHIDVSFSANITNLSATATVSKGATISSPTSLNNLDFSSGQMTFVVTAEDLTTHTWTVFVNKLTTPSSANDILTFTIPNQIGNSIINNVNHTVEVTMPWTTSQTVLSALVPTYTTSPLVLSSVPLSGIAQNFTTPVIYTVTAENGIPQTWTATVVLEAIPYPVVTIPYLQDFEGATPEIIIETITGPNQFTIGSGTSFPTGGKSLYISNDGSSFYYANTSSRSAAYMIVDFGNKSEYHLSFDWRNAGESSPNYDCMRAYLVPLSTVFSNLSFTNNSPWITGTEVIPIPSNVTGGTAANGPFSSQSSWTHFSIDVDAVNNPTLLPLLQNKTMKLVFLWYNDAVGTTNNTGIAIDNLQICGTLTTPIFASINSSYCQNETASLPTTSDNGITGTWSPAFSTATVGTTTYTFTPNPYECTGSASYNYIVTIQPLPTFSINFGNAAFTGIDTTYTICMGHPLMLSATGTGNILIDVNTDDPNVVSPVSITSGTSINISPTVSTNQTFYYRLISIADANCTSYTSGTTTFDTFNVNIIVNEAAYNIIYDTAMCAGDSIEIVFTKGTPPFTLDGTVDIDINGSTQTFPLNTIINPPIFYNTSKKIAPDLSNFTTFPIHFTINITSIEDANSCPLTISDTHTLTIYDTPAAPTLTDNASAICDGETFNLENVYNGIWLFNGTAVSNPSAISDDGIYEAIAIVHGCTSAPTNFTLTINALPTVDSYDTVIQKGPYTLPVVSGGVWTNENGTIVTKASKSGTYTLTVTNAAGCTATTTLQVEILTGFDNNSVKLQITVYPNPNDGHFTINFGNINNATRYEIIDAKGSIIKESILDNRNSTDININVLPGSYYVKVYTGDNKIYVEQIVIQ